MSNTWKNLDDDQLVSEGGRYREGEGAHAELQRRLMESIRNLDASTARYSSAIIALTLLPVIIELPLTIGAVGAIVAPALAAVGAIAALVTRCTIVVEKRD